MPLAIGIIPVLAMALGTTAIATVIAGDNPVAVEETGGVTSPISAVYPIEITLASGSKTGTQTIPTVDTSRAIVWLHNAYSQATGDEGWGILTLTNGTTVTGQRQCANSPSNSIVIRGTVIEFASGVIVSKQDKTINTSGSSQNATLSPTVDPTRSFAFFRGQDYDDTGGSATGAAIGMVVTASSTVTMYSPGIATTVTGYCTVVEFSSSYVNAVHNLNNNFTNSTDTTNNITIPAVNVNNSMVLAGGVSAAVTGSGGSWRQMACLLNLSSSTNVELIRSNATSTTLRVVGGVIEWVDGMITNKRSGTTSMNGNASATSTITAVDTSRSVYVHAGFTTTTDQTNGIPYIPAGKLSNGTTVAVNRGEASVISTAGWQVMEFLAP